MAAPPAWLAKLAKNIGVTKPAPVAAKQPDVLPGKVVLKPKYAPKPQGREITMQASGAIDRPRTPARPIVPPVKQLTPAAMVYALAAGILLVLAVYNLFHGSIFNGIVTLVPAGSLAVLAYKYHQ